MYGKNLALWCYMFLIASSSMLRPGSTTDNKEKNYSTIQYQFDASTRRNYDNKGDLIRYNLQENSTEDSDVMPYAYHLNFTNNDRENDDLFKGENSSTYDLFRNFDKYNIIPDKICSNIACIRLCCPYGNYLVNGKCIAYEQGKFIFLNNIYGHINDLLHNKNEKIDELFLLIVHNPCQKTGYYLLNPYDNAFLVNGSLYLPDYNTIVESKFYCLANNNGQFAVNVCFDIMKEIMKKTKKHNKNTIDDIESVSLKKNWMYNEDNPNRNNKNSIVPSKVCEHITCIRLCCPFGNRLVNGTCIAGRGNFLFLRDMYGYVDDSLQNENKNVHNPFILIVHDPCQKTGHYQLELSDLNLFFFDGSLYLYEFDVIVESTSYCINVQDESENNVYICSDVMNKIRSKIPTEEFSINIFNWNPEWTNVSIYFLLVHLLLSLVIFIVYFIEPELRNIHGLILRGYSISIVFVKTVELLMIFYKNKNLGNFSCFACAFIHYYFYLASWFWLSIMSIDMWRTFRKLRPLQRNTKQQERKKLIMYSVYGWGSPFIFAIICGITNSVSYVQGHFKLKFAGCLWTGRDLINLLYYDGVTIMLTISIICLCICTVRKIAHYEKDIIRYLRDSENQRYKDNEQWFWLYVEVIFIIVSFKIFMYFIEYLCDESETIWYIYTVLDVIQQLWLFIAFVWKKKIRQLLLKRFGCQSHNLFSAKQHVTASSNNIFIISETSL